MASEKAALEFQLEKSIKQFHEVQMEAERSRVARRSASAWEEDADIKALEYVHHFSFVLNIQGNRSKPSVLNHT
jgi:hypothetical protein